MGNKVWDPDGIFELFGDKTARRILVLASEEPKSADGLATALNTSHPTVYRRVNSLLEYDLLRDHQEIDAEGNHYKTFETTVDRVSFVLDEGSCSVDVEPRQKLVDQFDAFWSKLGRSSSGDSMSASEKTDQPNRYRDPNHG